MAIIETKNGGQWGDEGKGATILRVAPAADLVIRASGGANAGHTVYTEYGKFGLHLVPSGIFNKEATCLLGTGMLIGMDALTVEVDSLEKKGVPLDNLRISDRATLLLDIHQIKDRLEEEAKGNKKVGTTGRGIGPSCADRARRTALSIGKIADPDGLMFALSRVLQQERNMFKLEGLSNEDYKKFSPDYYEPKVYEFSERFSDRLVNASSLIKSYLSKTDALILGEGAQGFLLDPLHGNYPYVTSSPCTPEGFYYAAGLPIQGYDYQYDTGVFKAYVTKVGAGPLPSRLDESESEIEKQIREKGNEFGTTTGRPRDIAWFDAVAGRYAADHFTEIDLTKLDVLTGIDPIKVCVAYSLNGRKLTEYPTDIDVLERVEPVYQCYNGWLEDIHGVTDIRDLPEAAVNYLLVLRQLLDKPLNTIGTGPENDSYIDLKRTDLSDF